MNRYDFILASATVIVALAWFLFNIFSTEKGAVCLVYKDDILVDSVSLYEDGKYSLDGGNFEYVVSDGKVKAVSADCPDKVCLRQNSISRDGETIVCLPQKIVLVISSEKSKEFDGFTN